MNRLTVEQTVGFLRENDRYLVLTHIRPDGDAHGSAAALVRTLRAMGKEAYILENPETTEKFLPVVQPLWAPKGWKPDTVVSVDLASEGLFPVNAETYRNRVELSVDHHPSNTGYAARVCLNGTRASCGEIVSEIIHAAGIVPDRMTADAVYIAVSTDTGCFAYANTTESSFRTAGEMAGAGADIAGWNKKLFRTKSKQRIALEGMIFSGMEYYFDGRAAVITITGKMMEESGCTENDMDDVAAIPGGIEGVLCGITLREMSSPTDCKVSVRTTDVIDACKLCAVLGGGGHLMAAGASPQGMTVTEMKAVLLKELEKMLKGADAV